MPSSTLFLNSVPPSASGAKPSNEIRSAASRTSLHYGRRRRRGDRSSWIVRCSSRRSAPPPSIGGFDLYELLGVDSSSDQSQIKRAYRALQKRCHPDIAGPTGHDMAILLNEVYSFLSDPHSRSAYDQEQAKQSEYSGYTGKPLYSTWFGSETEERAVFVDEVKCVGCLKCALFANRTFAIESTYGRARVVAQWADPEDKILDAIEICPVDCISIVERSNLAALEFLMSKQPRGDVRLAAGNTAGVRVSDIFADVEKFQRRYREKNDDASGKESQDPNLQSESRTSVAQRIRSISNWWYWSVPTTGATSSSKEGNLYITLSTARPTQPDTERLREAAAALKGGKTSMKCESNEEYWTPIQILPSPSIVPLPPNDVQTDESEITQAASRDVIIDERKRNPVAPKASLVMAVISAAIVGSRGEMAGDGGGGFGLDEHIGGTAALGFVNSFELQVILAGATWFVIWMAVFGFVETISSKGVFKGKIDK